MKYHVFEQYFSSISLFPLAFRLTVQVVAMSRHRKAYDEDDLIDYDDYDDYDDYAPAVKQTAKSANNNTKGKSTVVEKQPAKPATVNPGVTKAQGGVSVAPQSKSAKVAAVPSKTVSTATLAVPTGHVVNDVTLMGFVTEAQSMSVSLPSSTILITPNDSASEDLPIAALPISSTSLISDDENEDISTNSTISSVFDLGKKPRVTVVVAGHVDAGKSTLVGNLLRLRGEVSQKTIRKYEKQSHEIGKGSFALAWVMDDSTSEREHGVTINVSER